MTELQSLRAGARALVNDYPMTIAVRREIVDQMYNTLKTSVKPRDKATAARALLTVEKLRLEAMAMAEDPTLTQTVDPEEARRAMREDPRYLEYLREQAGKEDD